ncbi:MAG TPA: hypothetical protein VFL08_09575 [Arthrobacter sp.]|nr:hypothetical protein [Arthrobacter sp.]
MVATNAAPVTETDIYKNYEIVVQLVSKGILDGVTESLKKLKDPNSFKPLIEGLANQHGLASNLPDPDDLYKGFWTLANGIDTNLNWRSSAGVPEREALMVDSFKPAEPPVTRGSFGINLFGCGLGFSW